MGGSNIEIGRPRKRDSFRAAITSVGRVSARERSRHGEEASVMWMFGDQSTSKRGRNPFKWTNPRDVSHGLAELEKLSDKDQQREVLIRVIGSMENDVKSFPN